MSSSFSPDESPTIVRNPSRSLWEAGLVGHHEAIGQVCSRYTQAIYAWMRAHGVDPDVAETRTKHFLTRLLTVERPDPQGEEVARLQDFLLRRLVAYADAGYPAPDAAG